MSYKSTASLETTGSTLVRFGLRFRGFFAITTALITILNTSTASLGQSTSSDFKNLNDFILRLHNTDHDITGNEWGWDLSKYPNLIGVYQIEGKTIVMTAAGPTKQLLLDPLTGRLLDLNQSQAETFMRLAQANEQPIPFRRTSIHGWSVKEMGSPGSGFSCHPPFGTFYDITNDKTGKSRSYYFVNLLRRSVGEHFQLCQAGVGNVSQSTETKVQEGFPVPYGLPDDTLLLFIRLPGYLLRLDTTLKAKSTVGGKVFLIDAESINAELRSRLADNPNARVNLFTKAIAAARN